MENKLFTIVNKEDEVSFLQDLKQHPDNFNKKLIFVFGNSENYIVVNGEKFLPTPATNNEYDYVDLGLPSGLKWATCNVGATSPEEYGLYFAWGETTGYTAEQVTSGVRVFDNTSYTASAISADLTLEQDAAHVNLGGNWRMPTLEQVKELIDYCTATWTDDYNGTGVAGRIFTGPNGNSVFFPAAGVCYESSVNNQGSNGNYWSASREDTSRASGLFFDSGNVNTLIGIRFMGFCVRGVCE